ncbi:hypothetical protein TSUD_69410 [Trifolium subterraneum]|uniref:non-specific serine/threonine protein kinase n=1 Tax=Trifolium subterraneum TaxID=3900 RepID=A0A2Z6MTT1_TRISU|nr:hypothetical protein TSUD_69410 [Trifolium subterraneum]
MIETGARDSELSLDTVNSMSSESICSTSFSRLSFDLLPPSPETLSIKPHRSSDFAYSAIRSATFRRKSALTFRDFHLLRRIGAGDIGTVYLCRLRSTEEEEEDACCLYAMKVVDKDVVALKKKSQRAEMERKILKMLDHPFLPTLYAEFEASHFSCIVMEFCSGAVESSDILQDTAFPSTLPYTRSRSFPTPFTCFSNRLFKSRKIQTIHPNRLFVAEPVSARSCSFVGTHEYVSPEVAAGNSHGNAVDWWSFGIFIYELIYGYTPFAAPSNKATLRNILKKPLTFPTPTSSSTLEFHARDLISGLLNKDPAQRLGSKRGAADVKKHPFFKGINLALIRMMTPPEVPGSRRPKTTPLNSRQQQTASFDIFF